MYVERNIEVRPRNHSYRGKAKSMTFLSVSVASVLQHPIRMLRIILSCDLHGCTTCFHIMS